MKLRVRAFHEVGAVLVGAALLALAPGAQAAPVLYDLEGSTITVTNPALPAPVVQPVTGSLTLDDDGMGNVSFVGELAFQFTVEVLIPGLASGRIETDLEVDVAGTGVRTGDVLAFDNPVDFFPMGTILCEDDGLFTNVCDVAGFPEDVVVNVPDDVPDETFMRTFGDLIFGPDDETFVIEDFAITEPDESTQQVLSLQGTQVVPAPSAAVLLAMALAGLALAGRR